jgi:hypothetical protein
LHPTASTTVTSQAAIPSTLTFACVIRIKGVSASYVLPDDIKKPVIDC